MDKWEYREVEIPYESFIERLNKEGKSGWELIGESKKHKNKYVFKRKKTKIDKTVVERLEKLLDHISEITGING